MVRGNCQRGGGEALHEQDEEQGEPDVCSDIHGETPGFGGNPQDLGPSWHSSGWVSAAHGRLRWAQGHCNAGLIHEIILWVFRF